MLKSLKKYVRRILFPDLRINFYRYPGKLEKLGSSFYGGWIIPTDQLNSHSICYLAGAGEDISFDVSLVKRFGCEAYVFDPTPRAKKHFDYVTNAARLGKNVAINNTNENYDADAESIKRLKFETIGLWKQSGILKFFAPRDENHVSHSISNLQHTDNYFLATVKRLSEIMKQNNHGHLDILKLDIEGAEFEVIDSMIEDKIQVRVLCVEFHRKEEEPGLIQSYLTKLEENGFRVVAREEMDFTFINIK